MEQGISSGELSCGCPRDKWDGADELQCDYRGGGQGLHPLAGAPALCSAPASSGEGGKGALLL